MNIHLLLIDPQKSFIDVPGHPGSLAVKGAYDDMLRVAAFIKRVGAKLADIHVTLDSHHIFDVAHPSWWKDAAGNHPAPFTVITAKDLVPQGTNQPPKWLPFDTRKQMMDRMLAYVGGLDKSGRYPLMIWPEHCIIGTEGATILDQVASALRDWEITYTAMVQYVTKGSNPYTEHYSAVKAEVPDPSDPNTQLNRDLIDILKTADKIIIAGEALSHCVANTVRDIADNFGEENVKKMVLLEDCSSNVPGCEKMGADFVTEMTKRGMQVEKSTTYLQ